MALQGRFRDALVNFASLSVLRDVIHALDPLRSGAVLLTDLTRALQRDTNVYLSQSEERLIKEHFHIKVSWVRG